MQKLTHQQAGELGEALTLAKINTLGLAAYMSPPGAPGHDIMVVTPSGPKSIEVKTRQHLANEKAIGRWPVDMARKGDPDFFVFCTLDITTISPTFYLLNGQQARETYRPEGKTCAPAKVREIIETNDFSALTL